MNGFITFWSKEYVRELEKHDDKGPFRVVYGSQHTRMPYISSVKAGDIVYPVCIREKTLCVLARLPVEKIERAYDYLIRETGLRHGALIPEGILIQSQDGDRQYNRFSGGSGYTGKVEIPENIHTVLQEEDFTEKPHLFHQEPITCCADLAASGSGGTMFEDHIIPIEDVKTFLFGKTKSSQKPLHLDKNGGLLSTSLSGFVRKMSAETFQYFEEMFN